MATLTFMTHTIFDHGASKQLAKVLKQQGVQRPLICTDRGLVELGMVAELTGHLGNELATAVFDGTPENPTQAAVQAAVEIYQRAECDGIVAFGGGSSMDLAKAVALAVTHEGDLLGYTAGLGGVAKIGPVAPLVAIPTTAGTGSEVSSGRHHHGQRRETDPGESPPRASNRDLRSHADAGITAQADGGDRHGRHDPLHRGVDLTAGESPRGSRGM